MFLKPSSGGFEPFEVVWPKEEHEGTRLYSLAAREWILSLTWAEHALIKVILYFSTAYSKTLRGIRACLHMSLFIIASKETAKLQTQLFSISLADIMLLQH